MTMKNRFLGLWAVPIVCFAVLATGGWALIDNVPYRVSVVLPTAPNVIEGGKVLVDGFEAGQVDEVRVEDGKAVLDMNLDNDFAPLRDGAEVSVAWRAVLGERQVVVKDGPADAPEIPDGGRISGAMPEPVEVDRVLSALDPETRTRLAGTLKGLDRTLTGSEQDINATIRSAGPALGALGDVLRGLGNDGPAIKQLIGHTSTVVDTLVKRDADVRSIVTDLSAGAAATAEQRQQLDAALQKLPGTLNTARTTLDQVPDTVDRTLPLLTKLQPVAAKLPEFSRNLSPVLQELRPAVGELRPTLDSASTLLNHTPALLDSAHATVPGVDSLVRDVTPALTYLRPYTPELLGWMSNWGSATANYDANGHYMRSTINEGASSLTVNPGVLPPGIEKDPHPVPGALEGQPWTDAYGGGAR
ncbi:phospholipid/cholesterol/gamma-HCH transport system substrate-binding protein [Pseudonocardia endophytica]|uniref:Phospholipid/cholesterol/gamma-HCH transport system substrate-binding protein n=2 Tax=Pseudonocardia endophytica TaxID=401976 RepID=A0A4R1HXP5_PSEEN|nr:phospholipid/cholesterol/gamma-HCH transport system substrate-binding protein [Pseudonocardia endophytica]